MARTKDEEEVDANRDPITGAPGLIPLAWASEPRAAPQREPPSAHSEVRSGPQ